MTVGGGGTQGRRGADALSRYFPIALLVAGLAALLVVLPSALRPPQQPPNTSAELSPDAPPDDSQDAIVSVLNRARSGTAGAGAGEAAAPGESENATGALVPRAAPVSVPPPRFCPSGFGDPPRQVESVYSAPCAASWRGDNGGTTYKGVTPTEIRIGVVQGSSTGAVPELNENEGPEIADEPPPDESSGHRTWRVYQRYFNQSFQFWERRVRFFVLTIDDSQEGMPAKMRAAVQELDESYHVFAVYSLSKAALEETARRKLVGIGGWNQGSELYAANQPFLVAPGMDGTRIAQIDAEYLCNRMMGHIARHAGDPRLATLPRKLGMITEDWDAYANSLGDELPQLVKARCGAELIVQRFNTESVEQSYPTAISQFRVNDVTTVIPDLDARYLTAFLTASEAQGYFPEWFIPGTFANDQTELPFLLQYNRRQWSHAFGISRSTIAQYPSNRYQHRAYRSIDPDNAPDGNADGFDDLVQLANGLQLAGPALTPTSFRQGLNSMGERRIDPPWSAAAGYAPGDNSYLDDVAEIWWDDTAPNPYWNDGPGSYQYVACGRRLSLGTIPRTEPPAFERAGTCAAGPGPG